MPTHTPARSKPRRKASRPSSTRAKAGVADDPQLYARRMERVRSAYRPTDAGWFLLSSPADVAYATGFRGGDSYLLAPVSFRERAVIISDFRYEEELTPQRAGFDIHIRSGTILSAVGEVMSSRRIDRCAIQADHMTVAERESLAREASRRGATIVDTKGIVAGVRIIKDDAEIACIERAIAIQEAALRSTLPTVKPGVSELDVAAELEAHMKRRGASGTAFDTCVAARANGSLPHYRPTRVKLARNQPLLIDWGAVYMGYRGDLTRTFSLGRWPAQIAEIYAIVLEAHERAASALRAGASTCTVDALARDFIKARGYGDRFGHGLGHGLGLHTHEAPRLHHLRDSDTELKEGMVVTIEPGIYLPGVGGVRIEDDYLVTRSGARKLSSLPRDMKWATL